MCVCVCVNISKGIVTQLISNSVLIFYYEMQ